MNNYTTAPFTGRQITPSNAPLVKDSKLSQVRTQVDCLEKLSVEIHRQLEELELKLCSILQPRLTTSEETKNGAEESLAPLPTELRNISRTLYCASIRIQTLKDAIEL